MSIAENIERVRTTLADGVKLVCVSKFHPVEAIKEAYSAGERAFGENRPQELAAKVPQLPSDIEWHFIGNLQTNKVKMVVANANIIESISSERLFDAVEKAAAEMNKVQDVLLELHVAKEETKQGFLIEEALTLITEEFLARHPHVRLRGVMGMASNVDDARVVERDFKAIALTFSRLKATVMSGKEEFDQLSMGMSGDYLIAQQCGSTIVRIGSAIFGARQY